MKLQRRFAPISGEFAPESVARFIGIHMVGHNLAPSLKACFLAYNNSIRLDLQALGIGKRMENKVLTPLELAAELDRKRGL